MGTAKPGRADPGGGQREVEPRGSRRDAFVASLDFALDPYQREALDALDAGR